MKVTRRVDFVNFKFKFGSHAELELLRNIGQSFGSIVTDCDPAKSPFFVVNMLEADVTSSLIGPQVRGQADKFASWTKPHRGGWGKVTCFRVSG